MNNSITDYFNTSSSKRQKTEYSNLTLPADWNNLLENELKESYFQQLLQFILSEYQTKTIYPKFEHVFEAFVQCPLDGLRVVIIGQDPYHEPSQAHGLCFSVKKGVKIPPSLRNIYKEAMADVGIPKPSHGNLTDWCKQGVFLLNTVLTVQKGKANSHRNKGWETFTTRVIEAINNNTLHIVFLLWGKSAQEKGKMIDEDKHKVIISSHPSPLGASKTKFPFLTSKCFSRTNGFLCQHYPTPIDWTIS